MKIKICLKICAMIFCIVGTTFLNAHDSIWLSDVMLTGLCSYIVILLVCVIVLAVGNKIDVTLDYLLMLIGATINITGGLISIIYYFDSYERYIDIPTTFLLPIGICALGAGFCMLVETFSGMLIPVIDLES